jgi:carbon storage regulator
MLVLTRKAGETVVIEGGIRVNVVAVKGNTVRLAIEAPPEVRVDRKEVHDRRLRGGFGDAEESADNLLPTAVARARGEGRRKPVQPDFVL